MSGVIFERRCRVGKDGDGENLDNVEQRIAVIFEKFSAKAAGSFQQPRTSVTVSGAGGPHMPPKRRGFQIRQWTGTGSGTAPHDPNPSGHMPHSATGLNDHRLRRQARRGHHGVRQLGAPGGRRPPERTGRACRPRSPPLLALLPWLHRTEPPRRDFLTSELPSLGQYAYYYAMLRTDYFLTLGRLFLDTTLMLFVADVRRLRHSSSSSSPSTERLRPLLATFVARDFHVPFEFNAARCHRVRELRINVLLPECVTMAAIADDIDIYMQTALRLAFWLLVITQHTRIHSATMAACQLGPTRPEVRLARVYTLSINIAAMLGTAPWSYQTLDQMKAMITVNVVAADSGKPEHDFDLLDGIATHSTTFRFLMRACRVTFVVLAEQGLRLDPESFYLETVVHSVDHCAAAAIIDPLSLIAVVPDGHRWCTNGDWICALFIDRI
ncbi:hypothetical protein R1flu_022033 [Riccia fluitans]|uniref:Uncharacterized protein n=1 Tax=Riccia fluitans TaxID=41844 RepID=A0ABD1ZRD8_9MARC